MVGNVGEWWGMLRNGWELWLIVGNDGDWFIIVWTIARNGGILVGMEENGWD